jgi:hypothetical protein
MAHLHLGILISEHCPFSVEVKKDNFRLVQIMKTQRCVTSTMANDKDEHISAGCCSKPSQKVSLIYTDPNLKEAPFVRKKSVPLKIDPVNHSPNVPQHNTS